MKSICYFGNYAHFSGALEVFRHQARHMKAKGWRTCYLYHMRPDGEIRPDMTMFDRVEFVPEMDGRESFAPIMAHIANEYDIVHDSLIPVDWRFLFKLACKRPMVETYHSTDGWARVWPQYQARLGAGVEKLPDATVGVSRGLVTRIAHDTGAQIEMIYNGVRVPAEPHWGGRYVTYSGRIAPDKGLPAWLEVASRVRAVDPTIKFQWLGGALNAQPWIWEMLEKGCPWLEQIGFVEDTSQFLQRSACLLMTSPSEGLPMCILEAMAQGVPAVSFNAGDSRESGCTIVRDVAAAAEAVIECARVQLTDSAEAAATKRQDYIRANFSVDRMCEEYERVYASCL